MARYSGSWYEVNDFYILFIGKNRGDRLHIITN